MAVERITDDVSDSLDLIDAQNFGSLNLETGEVNVTYSGSKPSETKAETAPVALTRVAAEAPKTEELDLISKLIPDETYEIIGSSAAVNPEAEEHFKIGTDLFNQKEYITARGHFEKAVKLEPKNDVYLLALEMVVNTMKAQGIAEPVQKPETPVDVPAAGTEKPKNAAAAGQAEVAKTPGTGAAATAETALKTPNAAGKPAHRPVKTQVFTCYFEERLPAGNIIFNTGVNTDIKKSDIDGYYVFFDNEKDAMALAAFRLDCEPKKAMLIVTQKLFADDNNFVFPLTLKVNNFEALNGAFRLATEFRPYQFDLTGRLHRGFNQILFQTAPFNVANYALLRVEIFIQNY
ncbi:MAG TPA: tetratricopeptide repeat protein [Candidatus Wallbacteria bacterium]|nr:tetratricopeptide repeat protein [Candidatus Wallbacteria bacterium]HPG58323.1 tetratricopeptide repeat protein [Candidatus Wallbacteria bacterium]